jgi:hypothetical protein
MGDCKGKTSNSDPETCPSRWIGDTYCDEECFSADYRWDDGDCFCHPYCAHPLLLNGICDQGCNNEACNWDWGDCDCAEGCNKRLFDSLVCEPECDNEECGYQNGRCLPKEKVTTYENYSRFQFVIYNQGGWDDGEECPKLKASDDEEEVYDNDEFERKKPDEEEPEPYEDGWETSGESKYFDLCYASYRYGYYTVTWDGNSGNGADDEHDRVSVSFNCDALCENCQDSFDDVENEACVMEGDLSIKIKFEYKEPEAASSLVVASVLLFVLQALHLLC